jgi:hypothetical protein
MKFCWLALMVLPLFCWKGFSMLKFCVPRSDFLFVLCYCLSRLLQMVSDPQVSNLGFATWHLWSSIYHGWIIPQGSPCGKWRWGRSSGQTYDDALDGFWKKPTSTWTEEEKRKDHKDLSLIQLHLSNNILQEVLQEKSAMAMWLKLESICMSKDLTSRLDVKMKFFLHKLQEGAPIVRCWPPSWEPQEEGMMSTAGSLPLVWNQGLSN